MTPSDLEYQKSEERTALPPLRTEAVARSKALSAIQGVVFPGQSDRTLGPVELKELQDALTSFRQKLIDQHHNEFGNVNASPAFRQALAWCETALVILKKAFADETAAERRRREDPDPFEHRSQSPLRTSTLFQQVQDEMRAAQAERNRQNEEHDRRQESLYGKSSDNTHSQDVVRRAMLSGLQTFNQALIGELKLLLLTNHIPNEQIDDVLRLLGRAAESPVETRAKSGGATAAKHAHSSHSPV